LASPQFFEITCGRKAAIMRGRKGSERKMADSGLFGPFDLTNESIDLHVRGKGAGAYALGRVNNSGGLTIQYVGRSDDDLNGRLKQHVGEGYAFFKYAFYDSAKAAYYKECWLWHTFGGPMGNLDNKNHPDKGDNKDWACPICGI
jgi:hypothetical protein